MKYTVVFLLLGIIVVVSSIPVEKESSVQQNDVAPEALPLTRIKEQLNDDSGKTGPKDELEGAESAYFGFPYYYPYVYKYPLVIYGK